MGDFDVARERARTSFLRVLKTYTSRREGLDLSVQDNGDTKPSKVEDAVCRLFSAAMELVPAYKQFVSEHALDPKSVKSWDQYATSVPLMEKENYLHKYPLPDRCIGGKLVPGDVDFIHVSSGSTGQPTFWARSCLSEIPVVGRFEQVLCDAFGCSTQPTLAVVAFPLGSWVGGLFTTFCLRYMCMKGMPITVVTPGNNVPEILRCVQSLAPMFQRTCLLGYPPFLKGVIDAGVGAQVPWSSYNMCMVFAGEVFSEEWRALVASRAGIQKPLRDMASLYGTADAGVIGNETPLSASIRSFLASRPELAHELFGSDRLPTLVQYDPRVRYLETISNGTIAITSVDAAPTPKSSDDEEIDDDVQTAEKVAEDVQRLTGSRPSASTVEETVALFREKSFHRSHQTTSGEQMVGPPPLIRYHIGDNGGVISFDGMINFVKAKGYDPVAELEGNTPVRRLPFCWVFGRSHWAVSIYGANVFVDQVMVGMEQKDVATFVTGKFILRVAEDSDSNPRVALDVELAPSISPVGEQADSYKALIAEQVKTQLLRLSSEFANYVPADRHLPLVFLFAHGDAEHFPVGVKHKYTK